jgi:hypothetical protein
MHNAHPGRHTDEGAHPGKTRSSWYKRSRLKSLYEGTAIPSRFRYEGVGEGALVLGEKVTPRRIQPGCENPQRAFARILTRRATFTSAPGLSLGQLAGSGQEVVDFGAAQVLIIACRHRSASSCHLDSWHERS